MRHPVESAASASASASTVSLSCVWCLVVLPKELPLSWLLVIIFGLHAAGAHLAFSQIAAADTANTACLSLRLVAGGCVWFTEGLATFKGPQLLSRRLSHS